MSNIWETFSCQYDVCEAPTHLKKPVFFPLSLLRRLLFLQIFTALSVIQYSISLPRWPQAWPYDLLWQRNMREVMCVTYKRIFPMFTSFLTNNVLDFKTWWQKWLQLFISALIMWFCSNFHQRRSSSFLESGLVHDMIWPIECCRSNDVLFHNLICRRASLTVLVPRYCHVKKLGLSLLKNEDEEWGAHRWDVPTETILDQSIASQPPNM